MGLGITGSGFQAASDFSHFSHLQPGILEDQEAIEDVYHNQWSKFYIGFKSKIFPLMMLMGSLNCNLFRSLV